MIEASIAIHDGVIEGIQFRGRMNHMCQATLLGLFDTLDDAGREEFVSRADGWPKHLREQVKTIVKTTRSRSRHARHYARRSWFTSEARMAINGGRVPRYLHF